MHVNLFANYRIEISDGNFQRSHVSYFWFHPSACRRWHLASVVNSSRDHEVSRESFSHKNDYKSGKLTYNSCMMSHYSKPVYSI